MKTSVTLTFVIILNFYRPAFSEEVSHKEDIKTGAKTTLVSAALTDVIGAMPGQKSSNLTERHPKTRLKKCLILIHLRDL